MPDGDVPISLYLLVQQRLRFEIERRIHIRHPIEQDGRLLRVSRVACQNVSGCQTRDAKMYRLLPLPENQICADEPPAIRAFDVSGAVIDSEIPQRLVRSR